MPYSLVLSVITWNLKVDYSKFTIGIKMQVDPCFNVYNLVLIYKNWMWTVYFCIIQARVAMLSLHK